MSKRKIVICEDHTIVLDGLKLLLEQSSDFEIAGHTERGEELLSILNNTQPDILILDLNLPDTDGLTLLEKIRELKLNVLVIILTMYKDDFLIERAKKAGANAFLLKNVGNEELLQTLTTVNHNDFYVSSALQHEADKKMLYRDQFVNKMKLTTREIEIIRLLASGKSTQEIADELFLSAHTVNTHRKNIFRKLDITKTTQLVNFAHDNNLI